MGIVGIAVLKGECMERLTKRNGDGKAVTKTLEYQFLINKLAEYEDLEEQGLLLKLPCSIGSDVYYIPSRVNYDLNILNGHEGNNRVYHQKVAKIVFTERGWYLECNKDLEYGTDHILVDKFYKETWFLSQTKATEALAKMERKK